MAKEKIKFYDVKAKRKFMSSKYSLKTKNTKAGKKYFAVTIAPSGIESWRIISKEDYKKYKG